ncbi:hypothetical protein EFP19_11790 [Burkholderia glumae]|nr:hypothetical protein EFP19_11790 [Burkholderia glumae]
MAFWVGMGLGGFALVCAAETVVSVAVLETAAVLKGWYNRREWRRYVTYRFQEFMRVCHAGEDHCKK